MTMTPLTAKPTGKGRGLRPPLFPVGFVVGGGRLDLQTRRFPARPAPGDNVVALWEAFHIWNKCFDMDTLRVPNRSPTPISKSNDFLGQSDDIWGARGPHFHPILGVPGVRAG